MLCRRAVLAARHAAAKLLAPSLSALPPLPTTVADQPCFHPRHDQLNPGPSSFKLQSRSVGILVELGLLPPEDEAEEKKEVKEVIKAVLRERSGSINSKKERREGRVPSIVYEQADGHKGGHKELISIEKKQLNKLLRRYGRSAFMANTFDLEIEREDADGKVSSSVERVIPKSVHLHCSSDEPLNVTFMRAPPSARINVDIPLAFVGEDSCPGIRKGGRLNTIRRIVRFSCPAHSIPPNIEVNLGNLDVGQKVLIQDLQVSQDMWVVGAQGSYPVCKIMGNRTLAGASEQTT